MRITECFFILHFFRLPGASQVLEESCKLSQPVEFNAGTLSGLFDLVNSSIDLFPRFDLELAQFELRSVVGEHNFAFTVRAVCPDIEKTDRGMHDEIFSTLRSVLYTSADFLSRELTEKTV